jgi:hypothetical protein
MQVLGATTLASTARGAASTGATPAVKREKKIHTKKIVFLMKRQPGLQKVPLTCASLSNKNNHI